MYLLKLKNYPVYKQLQLEEALLRSDLRNFCIINEGSIPAIVMGISGKAHDFIHSENYKNFPIPIIKRFSGGGTVIVDEDTIFVSFICQKQLHSFPLYPEKILLWTEGFYQKAFELDQFHVRENDYVIGKKKCGGNAQYIRKDRWIHHSTFLWDFKKERMDYLLYPKKTPAYREGRNHGDFLCTLSSFFPSKTHFIEPIERELQNRYPCKEISLDELLPLTQLDHRKATAEIFI
ncbi:MAG: lipoate--protein ligase family protein [Chlamydiae bacterium]|nr:lipoate--protein ligase family protein [Chlamydiota bacterium]